MNFVGVIFIAVAVALFIFRPLYLLPLMVASSTLEAMSVFDGALGRFEFGVPPFLFAGGLIAIRFGLAASEDGRVLPSFGSPIRSICALLLAYWIWACFSAFVFPHVFAGLPVYAPREGLEIDMSQLAPLQWSMSNLAQAVYVSVNLTAILYAARVVRTKKQLALLEGAFYSAIFISVSAGLLQMIFPSVYPYSVFNNNAAYTQGFEQSVEGIQRIVSTFVEPSLAGSFLSAAGIGLLAGYLSGKKARTLVALSAVILVFLNTTSTTGYASFALTAVMLLVGSAFFADRRERQKSILRGGASIVAIACAIAIVLVLDPSLYQAASNVTVEKIGLASGRSDNFSFVHRLLADFYSLTLCRSTWGLGVGLGSNRSASLLVTLLSTVGIVGTGLFVLIIFKLVKLFTVGRNSSSFQVTSWALLGLLIADSIGVPDPNRPALWGLIVVVVAQLNVLTMKRDFTTQLNTHDRGLRQTLQPTT